VIISDGVNDGVSDGAINGVSDGVIRIDYYSSSYKK
jgi:hypothetical protein